MSHPLLIQQQKKLFELNRHVYESALLTFKGVDGFDVYNCSVPFKYKGKTHIYGRVEKRAEWANSHVRLFVETGKDEFTALPDLRWELEDPYIQVIHNEFIFGGTNIEKKNEKVHNYSSYFYRGTPYHLTYFTTGPPKMKDVRTVQLADGRVGIFSRPKTATSASVGFAIINNIDSLCARRIEQARPLKLLEKRCWGGVNQPYLLTSGKVGCVAHASYCDTTNCPRGLTVYVNYSFILNPDTMAVEDAKIIGTKSCYPPCPTKAERLADCVFTSGIVMREDGKCDLYSGVGDTHEGRITIDYPFEGHGRIVDRLHSTDFVPRWQSLL